MPRQTVDSDCGNVPVKLIWHPWPKSKSWKDHWEMNLVAGGWWLVDAAARRIALVLLSDNKAKESEGLVKP